MKSAIKKTKKKKKGGGKKKKFVKKNVRNIYQTFVSFKTDNAQDNENERYSSMRWGEASCALMMSCNLHVRCTQCKRTVHDTKN